VHPTSGSLRFGHKNVLDLLRAWDNDGDGVLSRKEFVRHMKHLIVARPSAAEEVVVEEGVITLQDLRSC